MPSFPTVLAQLNVRVPMRDATSLATHVYLPTGDGPFPVLLVRTPYDAIGKGAAVLEWPGRGYAYVAQDTRGCFLSDGEDTLNWIAAQP